jgi:regulator of sigma E protease
MDILVMAGQLILALAILVSLHEWGHYIAARTFGIRVEKFFIFFDAWGIKLFSKKINDTEWGIGWLPLGGYVKITGMIDESLDKEQLTTEPEDYEFRSKPAWQRLIVMIGGVTVNFLLGILIFALSLWYYGDQWIPTKAVNDAHGIAATEMGKEVGFISGDKLIAVNGESYERFRDYTNPKLWMEESLQYTVDRSGELINLPIDEAARTKVLESKGNTFFKARVKSMVAKPGKEAQDAGIEEGDEILAVNGTPAAYTDLLFDALQEFKGQEVNLTLLRAGDSVSVKKELDTAGRIGVYLDDKTEFLDDIQTTKYGFIESFPEGTNRGLATLWLNVKAFGQMFKGKLNPVKTVSGPFQIAAIYGSTWDWQRFWQITGMLSFILAFMNLLPIPALDGGHVFFLLIEMLRGKPLPEKVMYYFQVAGMIILFALMAFILFVDGWNTLFNR